MRRGPLIVRASRRKKIRFPAWISYAGDPTPIPCMLWDVSEGGARITAAHSNILPDTFRLALSQNGKAHLCRVVWRKKPHVGIQFIEPFEAAVAPRVWPDESSRSGYGIVVPES